ncbi:hypothetical protein [Meiothermus cerbereus]|uniref:hypothetical protein n=1 Tax=Meiothermus cerbereus TaxID=65552 RepID=UPI003EECEFEC
MRVFVAGLWVLAQLTFAQDNPDFRVSWACRVPEEKVVCLQPSGLVQWSLGYSSQSVQPGLALGGHLQAQTQWEGVGIRADLGLWYDAALQVGLLEAYAQLSWETFGLSVGKRRQLSGPWDDTLVGRDGLWGLFGRYRPAELPWLGVDIAYLPNAKLAGGRIFLGAQADIFQAGTFVEIVRTRNELGELAPALHLNPRLGLAGQEVEFFWQLDKGFWGRASLPLALGQALGSLWPCPCDAETQAWLEALDRSRFELLVWWNPEWEYLGENSPFLPEERFGAWLLEPRKLLAGAAYSWNDRLRLAVDLSRAPVEALRVYLQLHWR